MAIDHNLEIIPVLNKMDMAAAMPEEVKDQIVDLVGCKREDIIEASAKTGMGVDEILREIVNRIPPPAGDPDAPLQALIFDSIFNSFRGIIAYIKIVNGTISRGDSVKFVNTDHEYKAEEIGVLKLKQDPRERMGAGDVGYIISRVKASDEVKVGDTITHVKNP
jgi:GTP-binding protein LepA